MTHSIPDHLQQTLDLKRAIDVMQSDNHSSDAWPFERELLVKNWAQIATPQLLNRLLISDSNCTAFGEAIHSAAYALGIPVGADVTKQVPVMVRQLVEEVNTLRKEKQMPPPIKDHEIAIAVNEITSIARSYAHTQQLRERIAQVVRKAVR